MAQLAEEHSLAAVPQQQPTTATSMSLAELSEEDDEDEYEYEYSVTETETYYVTLDLTIPDAPFSRKLDPKPRNRHEPFKWHNPGLAKQRKPDPAPGRKRMNPEQEYGIAAGQESEVDGNEDDGDAQDDSDSQRRAKRQRMMDAAQKGKGKQREVTGGPNDMAISQNGENEARPTNNGSHVDTGIAQLSNEHDSAQTPAEDGVTGPDAPKQPLQVQIIDLHTNNPIVSYGGQMYSCQWSKNIGSEFLFTEHDPSSALPVLRSLNNNVDLLGICSARIISTPANLEYKEDERPYKPQGRRPAKGRQGKIYHKIFVGAQASEGRINQGKFLENMMRIKKLKGERDEVTVFTEKRQTNRIWKARVEGWRRMEKAKLEKLLKDADGSRFQQARARLAEIEELERESAAAWATKTDIVDAPHKGRPGRTKKLVVGGEAQDGPAKVKHRKFIIRRPKGGLKQHIAKHKPEGYENAFPSEASGGIGNAGEAQELVAEEGEEEEEEDEQEQPARVIKRRNTGGRKKSRRAAKDDGDRYGRRHRGDSESEDGSYDENASDEEEEEVAW